jgi:hypothetical protein
MCRLTPEKIASVNVDMMTNIARDLSNGGDTSDSNQEKLQVRQQLMVPVFIHFLTSPSI